MSTHLRPNAFKKLLLVLSTILLPTALWAGDPISYGELLKIPQPAVVTPQYYGADPLQFGELRLPSGNGPFPVIAFIHGGCWLAEYDMKHTRPLTQALADAGYATWSIEYRRVGNEGGGYPGSFADIADGIDYLRELADKYPLDLSSMIAMGHSAGGQLALWSATRDRLEESQSLHRQRPLLPKAIIGLAAAADLPLLSKGRECDDAARRLMGGSDGEKAEDYALASPHFLVPLKLPQVLIDGEEDSTWAPISKSYYESALGVDDDVKRIVVSEAAHFDLVAPQDRVWPVLLETVAQVFERLD